MAHIHGLAQPPGQGVLPGTRAEDQHGLVGVAVEGKCRTDTVATLAASLHPEDEGTAADLGTALSGILSREVPVAGVLGQGLVQILHGLVENFHLGFAVGGRNVLRDPRRDLLWCEGAVDVGHVIHNRPALHRLLHLLLTELVDLGDDVLHITFSKQANGCLESRKVAQFCHVDTVNVWETDLRAARDDDDAGGRKPVQRSQDGIF
mmetsp:Transcript_9554/g.21309  ORF Transcript_9554/g.21309 Transcript_9554/m.21309 type:complete len:206 (+) Transcript_9554:4932-5549(+)